MGKRARIKSNRKNEGKPRKQGSYYCLYCRRVWTFQEALLMRHNIQACRRAVFALFGMEVQVHRSNDLRAERAALKAATTHAKSRKKGGGKGK